MKRDKTIAVLGGTGFVGSVLALRLAAAGWHVRVPSRHPQRHRNLQVVPQVDLRRAHVGRDDDLRAVLTDCDAAINLIAVLNSRGRDFRDFERLHVNLAGRIARACVEVGVPRLLHMSALRADAENGASEYLRSKGRGEAAVRREAGSQLAVTIFQPSVIFGLNDSFVNRFAGLLKLPAPFMPLPKPNARFAPVWVGDVAQAMTQSLQDKATFGKTYQLCGPQVLSLREVVTLIADAIDVGKPIVRIPDSLARMQAFLLEFWPGKPLSRDNLRSLEVNSICDNNGFEKLGLQPRSAAVWIPRIARDRGQRAALDEYRRSAGR